MDGWMEGGRETRRVGVSVGGAWGQGTAFLATYSRAIRCISTTPPTVGQYAASVSGPAISVPTYAISFRGAIYSR
eukprot:324099-Rhodomonas_salina.1